MNDERHSRTWEEMEVGSTHTTMRRTITEADLVNFVTAAGLFEVLFMDVPYLEEQSPYGGRLVPAALTYSYAEGLAVQSGGFRDTGLAFLGMELKVIKPVLVGDTVHVQVEVIESRASRRPGRGVVTTRNTVVNQRGEAVLEYLPVRLVKGRSHESAAESVAADSAQVRS